MNTLAQHSFSMFGATFSRPSQAQPRFDVKKSALLALVLGVHVAVIIGLMQTTSEVVIPEIQPPIVMRMVLPEEQVAPKQPEPIKPAVLPKPEVKPVPQKPVEKKVEPVKPVAQPVPIVSAPAAASEQAVVDNTPAKHSEVKDAHEEPVAETRQAAPAVVKEEPVVVPVSPPRFDADYLDNPAPSYPSLSRRLGEQGKVMLKVYVDVNGMPTKIELQKTSGFERLDNSAMETVKQWKFMPAKQGGQSIAAWVIVPIKFNVKS